MSLQQILKGFEEVLTSTCIEPFTWVTSCISLQSVCLVAALVFLLYPLLSPMNWVYRFDEVGWLKKKDARKNRHRRRFGNLPPVYPNGWFCIAESAEVKKEQVIHVSALGENFAVFRTKDGKVSVLDAYCPHLGANMAVGGKVRGDCLECPFHLWKFNTAGDCTASTSTIPKSAKVKKWNSLEVNDLIFVWYHAEAVEPSWYPALVPLVKKLAYIGRNEFHVNCHIQEIPENGSDMMHFKALHEASAFSGGDLRKHEMPLWRFFRHEWSSEWEPGTAKERHIAHAVLHHNIVLFGKLRLADCHIDILQTGPGYVTLSFTTSVGPVVLFQTVTPVEPLLQKVVHRIYSPGYLFLYSKFILMSECLMFKRDVMIWNNKMYMDKPVLTKDDSCIAKYRRWYSQFYTEHSPTYQSATQSYDW